MLDISLLIYIVFFVVMVIVFGIVYTLLTPIGHGIGQNLTPLSDITLPGGIYFSIVTVSSLGYGDMHPVGVSKAIAGSEVLIGLAVIGIMIAKVTSQRLSYHVSSLFSSKAQERLENIATDLDNTKYKFADITQKYASDYQITPGGKSTGNGASPSSDFQEVCRKAIGDFERKCVTLYDYFSDEVTQGNYFQSVPASAIVQVGDAVDDAFWKLIQLVISLPPQARSAILDSLNRQRIFEAIDSQKQLCGVVRQHATDQDTMAVFRRIEETCQQVSASYLAVPEKPQPSQILRGTNEPNDFQSGE